MGTVEKRGTKARVREVVEGGTTERRKEEEKETSGPDEAIPDP